MRKLVIIQNMTVDGAIEMIGDWFDPQDQSEDLLDETRRHDSQSDALLLGRRTFEDFRGYWPHQTDDATGITDGLNQMRKYVVSTTMTDPEWENSTILAGDVLGEVRALKERPGKDIIVTGASRCATH